MFKEMFQHQKNLQSKLGTFNKIKDESMKQKFINQMLLAVHEEAVEIMRETKYKNPDCVEFGWKKTQLFNEENYKEEIVDLFHFVMNLSLAVGMEAEEFYERYCNKNKINHDRQDEGY